LALRARVTTPTGQPVPNFTLNFVVTSGGGSVFGGAEVTNAQGYAEEQWTLGPRLGPQTVEARTVNPVSGVAASYGNFTANATAPHTLGVSRAGSTGLSTIYADGTGMTSINTGVSDIETPQLSADHQRVVFFSSHNTALGPDSDIVYQVNVNGTGLTILKAGYTDISPHAPSFGLYQLAPDGRSFSYDFHQDAYSSEAEIFGPCNCFISRPLGLSFSAASAEASFSPDMLRAAFALNPGASDGPPHGIWTASLSISGLPGDSAAQWQELTTSGDSPVWSPDGRHIAFDDYLLSGGGTFVMDADGNNVTKVTTVRGRVTWSPDGQLIGVDSGTGISLMNLDGSNPVALPKGFAFPWK
jgi:Tol biopolymer transport system component